MITERFQILAVAAWLAVVPACAVFAAGFDLNALMALLADHPQGRVGFVETRYLALLDRPIAARGELVYLPPDRLERHTQVPRQESAILAGDTLTLIHDGRRRELSLSEHPEVALLIGSLRAVLGGDRDALERDFSLNHAGTPEAWILDLLPRDPEALPMLRRIHLVGRGGQVELVETIETDGDRSVIEIGDKRP
nr:LolA-related protein [Thiorhodococcus minor]